LNLYSFCDRASYCISFNSFKHVILLALAPWENNKVLEAYAAMDNADTTAVS